MVDTRLIAIPPRALLQTVDGLDRCRAAVAGGVTALQVRMKNATAIDVYTAANRLARAVDVPIFINDRADVAVAVGVAGAHFGADDFPPHRARRGVPRPMVLGVSVGDPQEARDAEGADADYWSIGPFFRTATKADAGPPLGSVGFADLAVRAPDAVTTIAIGGIDAENAAAAIAAGARGVAVVNAVFGHPDPDRAARALRDAIDAALR